MQTIVIANNKGGVGKTTVASQIAFYLGRAGHSVIAVDLDGQRNLTSALSGTRVVGNALQMLERGEAPSFSVDPGDVVLIEGDRDIPVTSDDAVLQSTVAAVDGLDGADFCVIDTPPTFSALVYGALLTADFMLSPIELKRFSLDGVEGVLKAFVQVQEINEDIQFLGLLPSRFDAVKKNERETLLAVAESYSNLLVPHAIRNRVGYEAAEAEGIPVFEVPTASGKEAAAEFGAFFDWFIEAIEKED
ncbi:ATPase involved in chromosome partitioning (plasmid) [Phaeobacter piscinae]|uniref:ATPase involved in chromosome partitioning n=1 Tax=Phaeobacter piscinae TaxID=1580596 RepID=A0ABN5DJZ8_9RHOB|nr:ParA family protein [Phaeobacter piscinae]ATG37797.1 ATPase involved in chromosome partitioning [Phaeobacter piscinae]AUQ88318.1 ATPase involved in chromosome partitioning [Phaeobacter piscinae]AUR26201.1 ATPase involved in chromosome partitioning [Phaeobacter piscinae]